MNSRHAGTPVDGREVAPKILIFENTMDECSTIIAEVEALNLWQRSVVRKPNGESAIASDVRRNDIVQLDVTNVAPASWRVLSEALWEYGMDYAKRCGFTIGRMETPQLLRYRSDEDSYFKVHVDEIGTRGRKFSSILYLNDVAVGGETRFANFDVRIHPVEARIVFFPSVHPYEHEARPPQSSTKYCVVTWFHEIAGQEE